MSKLLRLLSGVCVLVIVGLIAGCGGGGGSSDASTSGNTTQSVAGVTTPDSVSVVTAQNAGN